ncbi:MAG: T9SS type A sorting domain-containing protein [Taibaiella sp.]|nr:T9SS type A sorting domain-containing protein [Taibaiella sp.]
MLRLLFLLLFICTGASAQIITTIAGNGHKGYTGDGGPAINATLYGPTGIRLDKTGNIYIADQYNNAIRKIDINGIITTVAGNGIKGFSGDGGPAINASLNSPSDIASDDSGNIYIGDLLNYRVRKINKVGIINTIVGCGISGYSGDGGSAKLAQIASPSGIDVDKENNLYIADEVNHTIRKVDNSGIISTIAGTGSSGYSGDGGPAINSKLNLPTGIRVDSLGNIFIADNQNVVIRKIDKYGQINTIAGTGVIGYSGDGGVAIHAELSSPIDVALDSKGNIYIGDYHSIRKIDASGIISTVAGNGSFGYSGDGGSALLASISSPNGIAVNSIGNIYIADFYNLRVREVTFNSSVVNNVNLINDIQIFPNPTNDQINITCSGKIESIMITNTIGKIVYKQFYNQTQHVKLDIKSFQSGVYFIKINGYAVKEFTKQ